MFHEPQFVIAWLLVAGVAVACVIVWRPKHDFTITVGSGGISVRGSLPPPYVAAIINFFRNDLPLERRVRVLARWRRNRSLQLQFRGKLSAFEQQRIRNFLNMTLRPG